MDEIGITVEYAMFRVINNNCPLLQHKPDLQPLGDLVQVGVCGGNAILWLKQLLTGFGNICRKFPCFVRLTYSGPVGLIITKTLR